MQHVPHHEVPPSCLPPVQVTAFRKLIAKVTADKHEEVLCRMGAIMAGGILDSGGRNMTVVRPCCHPASDLSSPISDLPWNAVAV